MGEISAFDIVACLILLGGMASGFTRGFIRQLADIAALYIGLAVAAQYAPLASPSVFARLPTWPTYLVTALVFFFLVAMVSGLLSLLAQSILTGTSTHEMNEVSQVVGFVLGTVAAIAFISVALPALRYAVAASWGTREGTRQLILLALQRSDLRPFFESFTPFVLTIIRPFLPSGIPDLLRGSMAVALPVLAPLI